jgi:Zn-dependent peptidase ImmA (M78 family)
MSETVGDRVRTRLDDVAPQRSQQALAAEIGMTESALSRALNGQRAFSTLELTRLAKVLKTSLHWLATGEPDPFTARIAARHAYDHGTGTYADDRGGDQEAILANVELAYRQAFPADGEAPPIALASAEQVRVRLGEDFIPDFAARVEDKLGIGVIRIAGVEKAYSLRVGGRYCIILGESGNWFYQNFSIAHELGHIYSGHFDSPDERATEAEETAANGFAAELLIPAAEVQSLDWVSMEPTDVANFVWQHGISTETLRTRIGALRVPISSKNWELLRHNTQRLLRWHWEGNVGSVDWITARMNVASTRRFPKELEAAHLKAIETGRAPKATLAWMMGVPESQLEVAEPASEGVDLDELAGVLGLSHGGQ